MARGARALATTTAAPPTLAHVGTGVIAGALAGSVGWLLATPVRVLLPWPVIVTVVLAAATLAVLRDLGHVPEGRGTQVPQHWMARYGSTGAYARYGLVLGATYGSHVPFSAAWVLLVVVSLQPSLLLAAAAVAVMAGVRTAAPFLTHRSLLLLDLLYDGLERKLTLRRLSVLISIALVVTFVAITWP